MRTFRKEVTRIVAELILGAVGIVLMYLFMVNVFVPGMVHTLSNMGRVPHATAPAEQGPPPTPR